MKKAYKLGVFVLVLIVLVAFLFGCNLKSSEADFNEGNMRKYYTKEDFQFIVVGESTYYDVYNVVPADSMQVTSYGGFCEYPMQNGVYIRIKFYGTDLIVGAIEEFSGNIAGKTGER